MRSSMSLAIGLVALLPALPAHAQESDVVPDADIMKMTEAACREKDFGAFIGDFTQNATVRKNFTAETVEIRTLAAPDEPGEKVKGADYRDFQIQMVDMYYVSAESWAKFEKSGDPADFVDISADYKQIRTDTYRLDWTRAVMEYPDDESETKELVRTIGEPGAYVFEYRDGCFRLTQDLR